MAIQELKAKQDKELAVLRNEKDTEIAASQSEWAESKRMIQVHGKCVEA